MKKSIALALSVLLLLTLLCGCSNTYGVNFTYDDADKFTAASEATLSGPVRNLSVGWINGAVELSVGEEDTISFSEAVTQEGTADTDDFILRYRQDGDTLTIRFAASGRYYVDMPQKTLKITLPKGTELNSLDIENTNASFTANGLHAEKAKIVCLEGRVVVEDSFLADTRLDTMSGNASITLLESPKRFDAYTVSGNLILFLPDDADFSVRNTTTGGTFNCDFDVETTDKAYVHGTGAGEILFETVSGSATLRQIEEAEEAAS